jgi:hypothetical protein
MSRRNPTEGTRNPCTRWFEWAGGDDGGFVRWYNKDTKETIRVEGAFTFLLLEELSTVKGWHEPSESSIYANEVKDTRQDVLVVKAHKGGELVSGLYKAIQDSIVAQGGHYHASIYLAYKDGSEMKLGNLGLKGSALGAWMEFKKGAGKGVNTQAVTITGFTEGKKGKVVFRTPIFALKEVSAATNEQALEVDDLLAAYLADYFKRPKADAAKPQQPNGDAEEPPFAPEEHEPLAPFEEDTIPF